MFPRKRNFLIFLVIAAIYSAATGLDLDKKDEKEDIISQNDDSREEPGKFYTFSYCLVRCSIS